MQDPRDTTVPGYTLDGGRAPKEFVVNQKLTLENAGDEAIFTVTECRTVQTKFGSKLVFVGTDDEGTMVETPLIPDTTALKQLGRLGLDTETVVGESLRFSRAGNPSGKPYWNIDPAGAKPAPTKRLQPAAPQRVDTSAAPKQKAGAGQIAQSYAQLWETMAGYLSASAGLHNIPLDASAVQAATATVWIALKDHGLQGSSVEAKAEPAPTVQVPTPSGKRLSPPPMAKAPAKPHDFSKVPPPSDDDATDDLPF